MVGIKSRSVKYGFNCSISQHTNNGSNVFVIAISEGLPTLLTKEIIYNYYDVSRWTMNH